MEGRKERGLLMRSASSSALPVTNSNWEKEAKTGGSLKHSSSMRRITSSRNLRSPPRSRKLLRFMAMSMTVLLSLHVCSAVLTGLSLLGPNSADMSDLIDLIGDGVPASNTKYSSEADDAPKLIPRIIHQTYKTRQVPEIVQKYMNTWKDMNPGWEVRFYDDQDCIDFVRREFPEYLDAYRRLRKDVERSDFFRYMVVLRLGGVYADIDTECRTPLDSIVRSRDTLIVGWENEFIDAQHAVEAWYVRTRQVLQWVFAGAPAHPALREVCDRIASSVKTTFSSDPNMDILERTGPGVFTDVVMKHAALHPPADRDDPWSVRILPRVVFGAPRKPAYGLTPRGEGVAVQHAFLGSWRLERRWWLFWRRASVEEMANQVSRWWHYRSDKVIAEHVTRLNARHDEAQLYPVSADFDPPFDVMTHLTSHGEKQSGWDVSSALTAHGSWQPSVQPYRKPSLAEALVGSLGAPSSREAGQARSLVDIGAGYGYVSLAAAARGHKVHAFELGPKSLDAFEAAIERNGFDHLVQLHRVPLGADNQQDTVCLQHSKSVSAGDDGGPDHTASGGEAAGGGIGLLGDAAAFEEQIRRGYAAPALHALTDDCTLSVPRLPAVDVLPEEEKIGAIRISANGWEGWIVEGLVPLLENQHPSVIAIEWNPAAMKAAGYDQPLQLIKRLTALGYDDVSHSGFVCDERWYAVTYGIRRRGGVLPEELAALKQPTWCHLTPEDYSLLVERASSTYPETLLFINKESGSVEKRDAKQSGNKVEADPQSTTATATAASAKKPNAGPLNLDSSTQQPTQTAAVDNASSQEELLFSSSNRKAALRGGSSSGSNNNNKRKGAATSLQDAMLSALHLSTNTYDDDDADGENSDSDGIHAISTLNRGSNTEDSSTTTTTILDDSHDESVLESDPAAGTTAQAVSDLTASARVPTLRGVIGRRVGSGANRQQRAAVM